MLDKVRMKPDWFPDWKDKYVAVIASGPSTNKADVELMKGRLPVVAIKKNVEIAPWADMVYGCDDPWWRHMHGLPDYKGLKVRYSLGVSNRPSGFHYIDVRTTADKLIFETPGLVGSGGNSGFQVVNLLAQIGVRGMLLIGFDANPKSKVHWYGRNNWTNANNPDLHNFRRWQIAFTNAARQLEACRIEVINASRFTVLDCFPYLTVEDALKKWGL